MGICEDPQLDRKVLASQIANGLEEQGVAWSYVLEEWGVARGKAK